MSKKIVSKKQHVILLLLYCFRFLNSKQVQEFLRHKDHRRINSWLKDLTEKGFIVREFTPIFGTLTKPAVYYPTPLGRSHIKNAQKYNYYFPKYLKRIARDNKASKAFKIRCQILADWYLVMKPPPAGKQKDAIKNQVVKEKDSDRSTTSIDILDYLEDILTHDIPKNEKIPLNSVQFFTPAYYPNFILLEKIKPDGYMRKKTIKGIMHGFLFVLDAYIPRFLLRYTLRKIFDTLSDEEWEDDSITSLHLYFLCPNNKIIIYIRRLLPSFIGNYYGKELIVHLATRSQLYRYKEHKAEKIGWREISSNEEYEN